MHLPFEEVSTRNSPLESFFGLGFAVYNITKRIAVFSSQRNSIVSSLREVHLKNVSGSVVSVDFFDTLVRRPVEPPEFVFGKIAEHSVLAIRRHSGRIFSERQYLAGRAACERALRRDRRLTVGLDNEAALEKTIERLLRQWSVFSAVLLKELLKLEHDLESGLLSLNDGAETFLVTLKQEKKRVLVLSDMYLSAESLRAFAEELGISQYVDKFYVSGEIGLGKYSGRLFLHVLRDLQVEPSELCHIGDNLHSDYLQPTKLGIKSTWLNQRTENANRSRLKRELKYNPRAFIDRVISERARGLYDSSQVLERTLFQNFAPAVYTYAYKSLRSCRMLGIKRLYFLAREGITLKGVFERVLRNHSELDGDRLDFRILYCSRASTVCARLDDSDDLSQLVRMIAERSYTFSLDSLVRGWNLDPSILQGLEENAHTFVEREELLDFLSEHPAFTQRILAQIRQNRQNLEGYLKQEGVLDEKCAFVDVGWGGTIQKNLECLLPEADIVGLYLGTNDKFEARNLAGQIFNYADYRSGAIFKSAGLTETLLSVPELGTTVGYFRQGDHYEPSLKPSEKNPERIAAIRERVFDDFAHVFSELTNTYCLCIPILTEHARATLFTFVCSPDRKFLRAVRNLEFNFDWGAQSPQPLVSKFELVAFLTPVALVKDLWRSPWVFGWLKANYLGVFCRPLSWMLGSEGAASQRTLKRISKLLGAGQNSMH